MDDPVLAYLEYLAQMSRKIAYRGTLNDLLGKATRAKPHRYREDQSTGGDETRRQAYIGDVDTDARATDGRTLIHGSGIVCGTLRGEQGTRVLTAPLLFMPVSLELDEDSKRYELEFEWGELAINNDLLTVMLERHLIATNDEDQLQLDPALNATIRHCLTAIEHIINEVVHDEERRHQFLVNDSTTRRIFGLLKDQLFAFRDIEVANGPFPISRINTLRTGPARCYTHHYYCMADLPAELSAYRDLKNMISQIEKERTA